MSPSVTTREANVRTGVPRRKRWLLLFAAPLLLSGCSMFTSPSPTKSGDTGTTTGVTGANEWLVVAPGSATPSPRPSAGASPAPTVTSGFLPLRPVVRPTPSPTCARDTPHFNKINALTVVPGTTSAKVSWYNVGGYNIVEFRITAISQDLMIGGQRDVGWVTIKPANPCGYLSATVPNLDRRTGYVFSVDAVVVRRSGDGTHAATIFRSSVVRTR
jgi:hypothetical protein